MPSRKLEGKYAMDKEKIIQGMAETLKCFENSQNDAMDRLLQEGKPPGMITDGLSMFIAVNVEAMLNPDVSLHEKAQERWEFRKRIQAILKKTYDKETRNG